jgi:hypothetical protein
VVGVSTALVMARFDRDVLHTANNELFLIVPLWDMLSFSSTFALAILWRRKPEYHRRLIVIATCALTAAGWGRFPMLPPGTFYIGVDALIILGALRDWIVNGRVHKVYWYVLPIFVGGQVLVVTTVLKRLPYWQPIAHRLLG